MEIPEYKVEKGSHAARTLPEFFFIGEVEHKLIIVEDLDDETDCG